MTKAYVFDSNFAVIESLRTHIAASPLNIEIIGHAATVDQLKQRLKGVNLIFLDVSLLNHTEEKIKRFLFEYKKNEIIVIGEEKEAAYTAFQIGAAHFLLKPFDKDRLIEALTAIENRLYDIPKQENIADNKKYSDMIGIPTLEGIEYFTIKDIIKCEGLQRCTRIVTAERGNIISSYNIGEFAKLLLPHGFYAPHKSYLVNLCHIIKYGKDGTLYLTNKHNAPVSRRRRTDFLGQIPHL